MLNSKNVLNNKKIHFIGLLIILVVFFSFCISIASAASDVYVDPVNGNDGNSGIASNPYKTIQTAHSHVDDGGTIHLFPGNYNSTSNVGLTISKNLNITAYNLSNLPILNGNYNTVSGWTINSNTKVNLLNLIFENGYSNSNGGAVVSNGNLTIINTTFKNNVANMNGGGLYTPAGSLTIENSTFINNSAKNPNGGYGNGGGGIFNDVSNANIINSTFDFNIAISNGGGIYNRGSHLLILNTKFDSNYISNPSWGAGGGAIMNDGYRTGDGEFLTIVDSYFYNNSAAYYGGAVYNYGSNSLYVKNSSFINNNALDPSNSNGGAIRDNGGNFTVVNSTFYNNSAAHGGAIHTTGETYINGTDFENNTAHSTDGTGGGALYIGGYGNVVINYNRFYHNNGTIDTSNAYQIFSESTSININLNWWGNGTTASNYAVVASWGSTFVPSNYVMVNVVPVSTDGVVYRIYLSNSSAIFDYTKLPLFFLKLNNTAVNPANDTFDARENGKVITISGDTLFKVDDWGNDFAPPLQVHDVYVNSTGGSDTGSAAGHSWDNPLKTIARALDLVEDGGVIHLAGGGNVYHVTGSFVPLYINRSVTIQGYTVAVNTANSPWNGNGSGSFSSGLVTINAQGNSSIFYIYPNVNVTMNNITFINSNNSTYGAIYLNDSNLTIANSNFFNNTGFNGGAIYTTLNSNLFLLNDNFSNNSVSGSGGAIYANGFVNITNSIFRNDSAVSGGAIFLNSHSSTSIKNTDFNNNNASISGGAILSNSTDLYLENINFNNNSFNSPNIYGGAIAVFNVTNLTVVNSKFNNNTAFKGGAIYVDNSSIFVMNINNPVLFVNNTGAYGSAIYLNNSNGQIQSSNFSSNNATVSGAIYLNLSSLNLNSSNFNSNNAGGSGVGDGGAVYSINSNITAFSNNYINNSASSGASIYLNESIYIGAFDNFKNNTGDLSGGAIYAIDYSNLTISNSSFDNNSVSGLSGDSYGGAIYASSYSTVNILYTSFNRNYANSSSSAFGGAIYFNISSITLNHTNLTNSQAKNSGGAIYGNGGDLGANMTLFEMVFMNNLAGDNGGAISANNNLSINLYSTLFRNNTANNNGGAISLNQSNGYIVRSTFLNNTVNNNGGAISLVLNSTLNLNGSNFVNNTGLLGGAVYIDGDNNHATINYNRFYHNNGTTTTSAQYQIYYLNSSSTVLNANLNWWGNATNNGNYAVIGVNNSVGHVYPDNFVKVDVVNLTTNTGEHLYIIFLNDSSIDFDPSLLDLFYATFNQSLEGITPGIDPSFETSISLDARITNRTLYTTNATKIWVDDWTKILSGVFTPLDYVYVNADYGDDSNTGTTWSNALKTIATALSKVKTGGTIHVAGASYNYNTSGANVNILISQNLTILGHTEGVDTTTNDSYNGAINADGNGSFAAGPVFIDGKNTDQIFSIINANVSLVNLTFVNGFNRNNGQYGYGGALNTRNSTVNITNCAFENNTVNGNDPKGGAVYISPNSSVNFLGNITFINNTAHFGGAIYYEGSKNLILANATFMNNTATRGGSGGGIYNTKANLTLLNCSFSYNTASGIDPGDGGGAIWNNQNNTNITDCKFINNSVNNSGGAIYNGNPSTNTVGLKITNSLFINNSASNGGAVYDDGGRNLSIINSNFTSNSANNSLNSRGGAILMNNGQFSNITDCNFDNNSARSAGGAIFTTGANITFLRLNFNNNSGNVGGGIFNGANQNIHVLDSVFINNSAKDSNGGGIYNNGGNDFIVRNSNFSDNRAVTAGGGIYNNGGNNFAVRNSNFANNSAVTAGGGIYNNGTSTTGYGLIIYLNNFNNNHAQYGGAIANRADNATITNSSFTYNNASYGGGVYNYRVNGLNISNSTFLSNFVTVDGGAIYISLLSAGLNSPQAKGLIIQYSLFDNNTAPLYGGAIFTNINLNISLSNFSNNNGSEFGGAIYNNASLFANLSIFDNNNALSGGAIYSDIQSSTLVVDSNFTNNNATGCNAIGINNGTGGGAIFTYFYSNLTISTSNFIKNTGDYGGAIWASIGANVSILNSNLNNNSALSFGGALRGRDFTLFTNNTNFSYNTAQIGGAIFSTTSGSSSNLYINWTNFINNSVSQDGGAIYVNSSSNLQGFSSNYVNNTADNKGGAVFFNGGFNFLNLNRFYHNNISLDNQPQVYVNLGYLNVNMNWWGHNITELNYAVIGYDNSSPSQISFDNHIEVNVNPLINANGKFNYTIRLNDSNENSTTTNIVDFDPTLLPLFYLNTTPEDENSEDHFDARVNQTVTFDSPGFKTFQVDDWIVTVSVDSHLYVNSSRTQGNHTGKNWENAFMNLSDALKIIVDLILANVTIHIAGNGTGVGEGGAVPYSINGINTGLTMNNTYDNLIISGEYGSPIFDGKNLYQIWNISANNITIANITFINGIGSSGGAIYNTGNNTKIKNSSFVANTANDTANGGAIFNQNGINFNVVNSSFINNTANGGGAIFNQNGTNFSVSGSSFINNNATSGGAIFNQDGTNFSVNGSTFINNTASDAGGAIVSSGISLILYSNFTSNNANNFAGAIWVGNYTNISYSNFLLNNATMGGAIEGEYSIDISYSNFNNNTAILGAAVHGAKPFNVSYCNFTYNDAEMGTVSTENLSGLNIDYSNFINNTAGIAGIIDDANLNINHNNFTNNSVVLQFGGLGAYGPLYMALTINGLNSSNNFNNNTLIFQIAGDGLNITILDSFNQTGNKNLIEFSGFANASVTGLTFLENSTNHYLKDSIVSGYETGIILDNTSSNIVINNTNITYNSIGVYINSILANYIYSSNIINNTYGIRTATDASNMVINYNRFVNNSLYSLDAVGSTNFDANLNWWSQNNISGLYSGVTINNYYVMKNYLNGVNGSIYNVTQNYPLYTNANLSYNFTLNDSNVSNNPLLLPYFVANVTFGHSNGTEEQGYYGDARVSNASFNTTLTHLNYTAYIKSGGDNEDPIYRINAYSEFNLTVNKTANINGLSTNNGTVLNNQVFNYTINVTNNGSGDAYDLNITDLLDYSYLELLEVIVTSGTYNNLTGVWELNLTAGESALLTLVVRANNSGFVINNANVTTLDNNTGDNLSQANITILAAVNLSVVKVANVTGVLNGQLVSFTITVTNHGPDNASSVNITEVFGSDLLYISGSNTTNTGYYNETNHVWYVGNISNGTTVTLNIVFRVSGTGNISNNLTVNSSENNTGNTTVNETLNSSKAINLTVVKVANVTGVLNGQLVSFTITVTNHGPDNASSVNITEVFGPDLLYISGSNTTNTGYYNETNHVWYVGNISNGTTVTLNIVFRVNGTGNISNNLTVNSSENNTGNTTVNETLNSSKAINLTVVKVANVTGVLNGQLVNFTITVTNHGPDNASSVNITEVFGPDLIYISGSNTTNTGYYNETNHVWYVGNISNGTTVTLNIVFRVSGTGNISNNLTVNSSENNTG
ncbi:DUF11 domain-containing protein, partial [Methanobrevibacter curvatus]|uniref:DUF11 domain-containing protein n=1 Tax=Methanobrevibacter curvatus TaxID=49547 RepID=UPI0009FF15C0